MTPEEKKERIRKRLKGLVSLQSKIAGVLEEGAPEGLG